MRILFVGVGYVHYFNQILNKLNELPGLEVFNLIPLDDTKSHVGPAVYQTLDNVKHQVLRLPSLIDAYGQVRFQHLEALLAEIRPDIIVATEVYLSQFYDNQAVSTLLTTMQTKIILKDIPFRLAKFTDELQAICSLHKPYVGRLNRLLKYFTLRPELNRLLYRLFNYHQDLERLYLKKLTLNKVAAHVCYVEAAYDIYASYGVPAEKIFITYNSPDTDELFAIRARLASETPILPPCPHRLIHVGRLTDNKRVDLIIRALSKIKQKYADAELLVIGYGPEEAALKALTAELGLTASVTFLGGIYDYNLLGRYFLASSVYVMAYLGGISLNDAMTFGKPVICSTGDGTEQKLVKEGVNGLYFKIGSADSLADKINYLFDRPGMLTQMGERSTKIIETEVNIHTVTDGFTKAFEYVTNN